MFNLYEKLPKWAFFSTIFVSLLIKIYIECNYAAASGDHFAQFVMAFHLHQGNGMSYSSVDLGDLSKVHYEKVIWWPPGFILLLAIFFPLFQDFMLCNIFLDSLAMVLLWIVLYQTFQLLQFKTFIQFAIFLFLGISFSPLSYLFSTDLWSMLIFQFCIYLSLRILKQEKYKLKDGILLSLMIFLIVFFKYMYYALLVFPFAFVLFAYFDKHNKKKIFQFSISLLIFTGIFTISFLLFLKTYSGSYTYLGKQYNGYQGFHIYWEHLKWLDFFPFRTFFYLDNINRFMIIYHLKNDFWDISLKIISYSFSFYFVFTLFVFIKRKIKFWQNFAENRLVKAYFILFLITLFLNVGYLIFLSLLLPPQTGWTDFWTYVQETRYYAPSMLLFLICFFYLTLEYAIYPLWDRFNQLIIITAFIFASIIMSYRVIGIAFFNRDNYNIQYLYEELWSINAVVKPIAQKQQTVFISKEYRTPTYTKFTGAATIDLETLKNKPLKTSKPITVLLYTTNEPNEDELNFIRIYQAKPIKTWAGKTLYQFTLNPQ